ncbi:MAG: dephospho-CoA kinase [Anaerovoracaceae bacterium]
MKVIGLTGGIGAGKSTVSNILREKGCCIIDADAISHQITEKGSDTLQQLAKAFGEDILFDDGSLDRKKLAAIAFSDEKQRRKLEDLTTKRVLSLIDQTLQNLRRESSYDIIFIDAPLLFETGADKMTDLVWLVTAEKETRIARVMERDGATRQQVLARMSSQMDDREKERRTEEIIDNSKGKEELRRQVEQLLVKYAEPK